MPNVHGVEFNANQSELVKDIVRELLKDGSCAAAPGFTIPAGENDPDSEAGTADGMTRCKAGIAREAINTAVQAESSNLG